MVLLIPALLSWLKDRRHGQSPGHVFMSFLAIVTHPRIYDPPTPLEKAISQVDAWMESPSLLLLSESEDYWQQLQSLLQSGKVCGPQVHDARIAALCSYHGVAELWTADRDFGRFPKLKVRNPLAG